MYIIYVIYVYVDSEDDSLKTTQLVPNVPRKVHAKKMNNFFHYTDHDHGTPITRAEWKRVMQRDDARHWFGAQGLPIRDPDVVFDLLDTDKSQSISMDELVSGVSQLQGVAHGVDIAVLKRNQQYLVGLIEKLMEGGARGATELDDQSLMSADGNTTTEERTDNLERPIHL